jgi:AraC family ethanolamine operon transcriptional activator
MDTPDTGPRAPAAPIFPAGIVQAAAFDDFDAMAAAPRAWDQHYLKLSKGSFEGSVRAAHTACMQAGRVTWSSGVLVTGAVPKGAISFAIPIVAGGVARAQGIPVRTNQIVAIADRDELNFTQPSGCELLVLSLGHGLLDLAAATFFGEAWRDAVPNAVVLAVQDAARLAADYRRLLAATRDVDATRLAEPAFGRRLELAAAETVAAQIAIQQPRRLTSAQRQRLARRVEGYLQANEFRPVGIAELCAAVGAPERTMHHACREYFGLPPVALLRVRRLHRARRQLLARGSATTVTATATDWGFDHLGEFAVAYRRLFGETPSQTLRRKQASAAADTG